MRGTIQMQNNNFIQEIPKMHGADYQKLIKWPKRAYYVWYSLPKTEVASSHTANSLAHTQTHCNSPLTCAFRFSHRDTIQATAVLGYSPS